MQGADLLVNSTPHGCYILEATDNSDEPAMWLPIVSRMMLHFGRCMGSDPLALVRQLAGPFRVSPDQLTERQVRDYLMHLREVRKVAKGTFQAQFFGIKFFFVNTLGYDWPLLTKKKSANPIANACQMFEAMRTAAA